MTVGILFDLDGTLLDTLADLKDAVNYALGQYGCPERSLAEIRSFVGNGVKSLLRQSLPGKETDPDFDEFMKTYQAHYALHNRDKTAPYAGVLEVLEVLKGEYPVAIVSNKHHSAVQALCAFYFGDVYARGEQVDCPRKSAPDMLLRTMEDLHVDKCIYVGDSEVDVLTARNAGVPCLSVLWGFRNMEELQNAGGKHFCNDVSKLPRMLKAMIAEYYGA